MSKIYWCFGCAVILSVCSPFLVLSFDVIINISDILKVAIEHDGPDHNQRPARTDSMVHHEENGNLHSRSQRLLLLLLSMSLLGENDKEPVSLCQQKRS